MTAIGVTDLRLALAHQHLSEHTRITRSNGPSASQLRRNREERDLRDAAAQAAQENGATA